MKKIFYKILPLLAIILFSTCGFEFSEDYYKEIKVETPTASLSLLNFTDGKVYKKSTNINFEYSGNDKHRLDFIQIFIDNKLEIVTNDLSGSFFIDTQKLSEGKHNIKVEYSFSSGTGSLAEINNLENYYVIEEFSFSIDKSLADAFPISNVKIEDGTINIYWEDIKNKNFDKAYLITKYNGSYTKEILLTEDILSSKKFNDNQNTNGKLSYQIRVVNSFKKSESNIVEIEINHPKPSYKIIGADKILIKWEKHPLYANFDYYIYTASYLNDDIEIRLDKNGGELIINIEKKLRFEDKYSTNFVLYRNNDLVGVIPLDFYWGEKFENLCYNYVFNPLTNSFFGVKRIGENNSQNPQKVYIYEFSSEDLSLIKKTLITSINYSSRVLTLDPKSNDLIIDYTEGAIIINPNTHSVIREINAFDYTNKTDSFITQYRNGVVYIYDSDYIYFYNAESKKLFYTTERKTFDVSDNGKYFFTKNDTDASIYEINNFKVSKLIELKNLKFNYNIQFLKNKNKVAINAPGIKPYIFDLDSRTRLDFSGSFDIDLVNTTELYYDHITNKVLFQTYDQVVILDLDSNKKYYLDYDSGNNHRSGHYYSIINNKFISSNGFYLDYFEK